MTFELLIKMHPHRMSFGGVSVLCSAMLCSSTSLVHVSQNRIMCYGIRNV